MKHGTKPTDLGMNRTGIATAPARAKEAVEGAEEGVPAASADGSALARARAEYAKDAPPYGTVPPPMTVKGAAKAAAKALKGEKATVLLDQLAKRLAFERTGVRLYDALLAKVPAAKTGEGTLTAAALRRMRDDELKHFHLLVEAIRSLGADPTAETPSADLTGIEGSGLVKAVTDPRTTLTQALDAILVAELGDNDGWKLLIAACEALGQDTLARRFTEALADEDRHLQQVRTWLAERLEIQLGAAMPSADFGEPVQPS